MLWMHMDPAPDATVGTWPMIRMRSVQLLVLGIVLGFAIWILAPLFLGTFEPWDSPLPVWSISWLVMGVLGGLTRRARGLLLPVGYALGQILLTIRSPFRGEFGTLGWLFILWFALLACIAALGTAGLMIVGSRLRDLVRARRAGR